MPMTDGQNGAAPGWYDDGHGMKRWWDGGTWTSEVQRPESAAASPAKVPARHPDADKPDTIWSAVGRPLTGWGPHKVRLTADLLYFERGVVTTDAQQVHTWEIQDVDAKQSFLQKGRGTGDITVHTVRYGKPEWVLLVDLPDYREGVRLINEAAHAAIERRRQADRTQHVSYSGAAVVPGQPAAAAPTPHEAASTPANGLLEQLAKLGEMKAQGILTDEEFAAAKARLLGL